MVKIDNEKCIEIKFSVSTTSSGIIAVKKEFKEYAEELSWDVRTDKEGSVDEDGSRMYEIIISPRGKKISPEEFRKKKGKLVGFVYSILRNIIYPVSEGYEDEEVFKKIITTINIRADKKKCIYTIGDVLFLEIETDKLLELEKKHHNLARAIFDITLKEWKDDLQKQLKKSSRFWFNRNKKEKEIKQELIDFLEMKSKN